MILPIYITIQNKTDELTNNHWLITCFSIACLELWYITTNLRIVISSLVFTHLEVNHENRPRDSPVILIT